MQPPRSSVRENGPAQSRENPLDICYEEPEERGQLDWNRGHLRAYGGKGDASLASSLRDSTGRLPSNGEGTLDLAPQTYGNEVRGPGRVETKKQHGSMESDPHQALGMMPLQPLTPRDINNGGRGAKPYATEESLEVRT